MAEIHWVFWGPADRAHLSINPLLVSLARCEIPEYENTVLGTYRESEPHTEVICKARPLRARSTPATARPIREMCAYRLQFQLTRYHEAAMTFRGPPKLVSRKPIFSGVGSSLSLKMA